MKVAVFTPYGLLQREVGLIYIIANFLAKSGAEVIQFRCDGAVSACGRDSVDHDFRTPFQCARCINEQRELSNWAGLSNREISLEIGAEDILKTEEWLRGLSLESVHRVEFRGVNLWNICSPKLLTKWGELDLSQLSEVQWQAIRALFSSYVRAAVASERFIERWQPKMNIVSSINDPLAHAFLLESKRANIDTAVCDYDQDEQVLIVESLARSEHYTTELVLERITSMRSDPRTWGPEVTAMVHEVLTFLGCAPDRVLSE